MRDAAVSDFVRALAGCTAFEEAAAKAALALAEALDEAVSASPYAGYARTLQAVVHLRPGDGYRDLAVIDLRGGAGVVLRSTDAGALSSLSSATAWGWVSRSGRAVAIDVKMGKAESAGRPVGEVRPAPGSAKIAGQESQARWMKRDVTHVYVLPLRAPGGAIGGMIALEVECRPATAKAFVWGECEGRLALIASVAAPHLLALPSRAPEAPSAFDPYLPVVGASMRPVVEMLRVFAAQDETILLSGPTGAGKSRLARFCHERAGGGGRPFETFDIGGPESTHMAALFGWKKGAFTDAVRDTEGALARAEGGTLFIDEIDKFSLDIQARLLRVLEERRYRPLGDGAGERTANVRFIVGTNVDLKRAVDEGRFREDLYFRINVLPVRVPPLRERPDEVGPWAEYMLERRRGSGRAARFSEGALGALKAYPWPGNLRQLDNVVRRVYALALLGAAQGPSAELSVDGLHVAQALALEGGDEPARGHSLVDVMALAARAFVAEAEQKHGRGEALDLDLADALRGFALKEAAERLGSIDKACRFLGKGAVVENRNHMRFYRQEVERIEALRQAVEGRPGRGGGGRA